MFPAINSDNCSLTSDSLGSGNNVREQGDKIYRPEREQQTVDGQWDNDDETIEVGGGVDDRVEFREDYHGLSIRIDSKIGKKARLTATDRLTAIDQFNGSSSRQDYSKSGQLILGDSRTQANQSGSMSVAYNLSRLCTQDKRDSSLSIHQATPGEIASSGKCSATNQHQSPRSSSQRSLSNNSNGSVKDFEEVKQVDLFGSSIVALTIHGRERLCLAQISNTLLKDFSYNEIHNRRVALGITCVQCTPIQLEMLRRAGAMPSSSRRCGMITRREAERLCRSFLVDEQPPELPENFYFTVAHRVNYGCKGRFVPARYISSRAKCIECFYCGEYYSPNKFIFHSHRQPHATDCNPPDSPNINSWRKHIDLDWTQEHNQDVRYAWEDVKSLFNGGTRRRGPNPYGPTPTSSATSSTSMTTTSTSNIDHHRRPKTSTQACEDLSKVQSKHSNAKQLELDDQLIDVESHDLKFEIPPEDTPQLEQREYGVPSVVAQVPLAEPTQNSLNNTPKRMEFAYPMSATAASPSFIYNQLYSQLVQQQQQPQQQQRVSQTANAATINAQLAIRHHLWSSLLANLQCSSSSTAD